MHMDIQCQGLTLTTPLSDYVRNRLAYALLLDDEAIVRVNVSLHEGAGCGSGSDSRCRIEVWLNNAPKLEVEDGERELALAIDRAAQRIGRALVRHLARRHPYAPPPDTHAGGDMNP